MIDKTMSEIISELMPVIDRRIQASADPNWKPTRDPVVEELKRQNDKLKRDIESSVAEYEAKAIKIPRHVQVQMAHLELQLARARADVATEKANVAFHEWRNVREWARRLDAEEAAKNAAIDVVDADAGPIVDPTPEG